MSEKGMDAGEGATLWDRIRAPWREALGVPEAPDELTLAAYLDGALDEAAAEAVETWMAAAPEGLDSVLAARAALAAPLAEAPERVVARARAIVRAAPAGAGTAWWNRLFDGLAGPLRPAAWATAAALLLASVSGFELGRMGVEHLASLDAAVAEDVRLVMGRTGSDLL